MFEHQWGEPPRTPHKYKSKYINFFEGYKLCSKLVMTDLNAYCIGSDVSIWLVASCLALVVC